MLIKRTIYSFFPAFLLVVLLLVPTRADAATLSSQVGVVKISSGWLNVRSSPSTTATKVTSLQKGSYVTLISKNGSWWQVEYAKGKYGYCHSDYITGVSGTAVTVATKSGPLNVRSGAGTSYAKTASLYKGEAVIVLSSSNGWSRILYHGTKTGYVSSQYLSNHYGAVSISVPNLKQTDSRWADITIGSSGKTFAQIGCATTAIAMVESRRRGYTVYPDAMAQELRYTASGNVYWPQDYITVTDSTGYLEKIYSLLKQGKVVLFGARNTYGSQHWVVINGYTGGEKLTASGFTIRDPGTYSRTTLQQFLNVYPTFYKYFYY